jgi:hypothetical protein
MNLTNFKTKLSPVIYERGEEYFMNDAVSDLEQLDDNRWLATVEGSEDYNVAVEIDLKGNILDYDCDCPYDGEICKHVVATILMIKEDWDSGKETAKKDNTKKEWQQIILKVSESELRNFVIEYAKKNKGFKNDLVINFAEFDNNSSPEKYRKLVKNAFRNAGDRDGYINYYDIGDIIGPLNKLINKADSFKDKNDFNEAFLILSVIPSECIKMIDCIDDSDGEFGGTIMEVFDSIVDIYKKCNDSILKKKIFEHLLHEAGLNKYHDYGCADNLEPSLLELSDNKENTEALHRFFDKKIKDVDQKDGWSKDYALQSYIGLKAQLYELSGESEKAGLLIEQNLQLSKFRQKFIDKKLKENKLAECILLLEQGIEIAKTKQEPGTEKQWKDQLLAIYQKQSDIENIRKYSLNLYFSNWNELKYYRIYRKTWNTNEWIVERQKIIETLQSQQKKTPYGNYFNTSIAEIYVEEKMIDELFKMVEKSPMINTLMSYSKHLKEKYSIELAKFFKSAIEWYLGKNTGRSAYQTTVGYFKEMAKLNGGNEMLRAMINNFKIQYKNRPAMMDEFKRAGLL